MTTDNRPMFPKAFYDLAGDMHDIHGRLNTSFGDFSHRGFLTSNDEDAKESVEVLRRLINLRERQIEEARQTMKAYEAMIAAGTREWGEFQTESFNRDRAEVA